MTVNEIQLALHSVGKLLRKTRELNGLSVHALSGASGLTISEIVRLEDGEVTKFHDHPEQTLNNLRSYAAILGIKLQINLEQNSHCFYSSVKSQNTLAFSEVELGPDIPPFLRKN
jgi:transcriptional regulator with XRE-family HTH domain